MDDGRDDAEHGRAGGRSAPVIPRQATPASRVSEKDRLTRRQSENPQPSPMRERRGFFASRVPAEGRRRCGFSLILFVRRRRIAVWPVFPRISFRRIVASFVNHIVGVSQRAFVEFSERDCPASVFVEAQRIAEISSEAFDPRLSCRVAFYRRVAHGALVILLLGGAENTYGRLPRLALSINSRISSLAA